MGRLKQFALTSAALLWVCSCAVGPDYKRPDVSELTPVDWRWKTGEPKDALPKGEWWKIFHDPILDKLEAQAVANNQDAWAALARIDQARAAARLTRSRFFPELTFDPLVLRQRSSGHLPSPIPFDIPSAYYNTFSVPLDASYEVDLWGRIRRSFESSRARAEASVADYENLVLTLTADVAVDYYLLRSLDAEVGILQRTVELRTESLRILEARFAAGTTPEIDAARAKAELATAKEDRVDTTRQRAETLNALSLLCGQPSSSFQVTPHPLTESPPTVQPGVPSSLLERRPDIATAERNLAAQNAQIGVAQAAYFPALRLTGQAGYLSAEASSLFASDSRVWSVGPSISLPVFNAGRTAAEVKRARAAYQEALAAYRQIVLRAFKEVEDALSQIAFRNEQASAHDEAVSASTQVHNLAKARYEAGATSYLEVVDAERDMLRQLRQQAVLRSHRFTAAIRLIKALGGGWGEAIGIASADSAPAQGKLLIFR